MSSIGLISSLFTLALVADAQPAAETWTVAPPPTSPPLFVIGGEAVPAQPAPAQPVVVAPAPAPQPIVVTTPAAAPTIVVTTTSAPEAAPAPLPFPATPPAPAPASVSSEATAAVVIVPTAAVPPPPAPPPPVIVNSVSPAPAPRRAPPAPRGRNGVGMVVAGASILGTTWLFSSLAGAIMIDNGSARDRRLGRSLLAPVVGPWVALSHTRSATGAWFLSMVGVVQATGALLTAGGIVRMNRYRRLQASRGLSVGATPIYGGGGQISVGMRF